MLNYSNILLLGFGHKARQGKDSAALYLKEKLNNVEIVHWADSLYEQCKNERNEYPLIKQEFVTPEKTYYSVLSDAGTGERVAISSKNDPFLHKIFTQRNITEYWGMTEKDPEILQFWGTNFRRNMCDKNYWINLTMSKIEQIAKENSPEYIIIADTRFKNEVEALHLNVGYYVKIIRVDEFGNVYGATDRSGSHESEVELENYPPDLSITAKDLPSLKQKLDQFIELFINPIKTAQKIKKIE